MDKRSGLAGVSAGWLLLFPGLLPVWAAAYGGVLHLKGAKDGLADRSIVAALSGSAIADGLPDPGKRLLAGYSRVILHYSNALPGVGEVSDIREAGGRILSAVPEGGLLVLFADGARLERLRGEPRVVQMVPALKLSSLIGADFEGRMVVEFFPDVTGEEASTIVKRSGLREETAAEGTMPGFQRVVRGGLAAARELAKWNETAYVFPAAMDLDASGPACVHSGIAVTGFGQGEQGARLGQYVAGSGSSWASSPDAGAAVGYFVEGTPEKLASLDVERAFGEALREWERFTHLRFERAQAARSQKTLSLRFAAGEHGDAWPFDGAGRVLAHAFYPAPLFAEPLAGDLHVDLDEEWTQQDVYSVILHEVGHALGLVHSDDPSSVMYPMYRRAKGLGAVDIAAIRDLYGIRKAEEEGEAGSTEVGLEISEVQRHVGDFPPGELVAFSGRAWGSSAGGIKIRWKYASGGGWIQAMGAFDWIAPIVPLFSEEEELIVEAYDGDGRQATRRFRPTRFPNPE